MSTASSDRSPPIQALAAAFSAAITAEEVADIAVTQGLSALNASVGILAVLNDSRTEFRSLRIVGCSPEVVDAWKRFPADAAVPIAQVVRDNLPLFFPTFEERQSRYPLTHLGGALVALPILRGNLAGGLGFTFPTDRPFAEEDFDFLGKLADLCGEALNRIRLQQTPTLRILVVDDLRDAADSMAVWLRLLDHDVRVAYHGQRAMEIAREFRPDVALLDLALPGMSGYDVATQLRQEPGLEDALIVAISGYGQEEDRRRCQQAGFDAHFLKPADPDELLALFASRKVQQDIASALQGNSA